MKATTLLPLLKGFLAREKGRITRGLHFADGYAVATDSYILAKCRYPYPEANEGATVDFRTGGRLEGRYPDYMTALAAGRDKDGTVSAKVDMERAAAYIEAGRAVAEANGYKPAECTVSMSFPAAQGGRTLYFRLDRCCRFFNALGKYGADTIRQKRESDRFPVYSSAADGSEFLMMPMYGGELPCVADIAAGVDGMELHLAELFCMERLKGTEGAAFRTAEMRRTERMLDAVRKAKELPGDGKGAPEMTDERREEVERRISELEKKGKAGEDAGTEDRDRDARTEDRRGREAGRKDTGEKESTPEETDGKAGGWVSMLTRMLNDKAGRYSVHHCEDLDGESVLLKEDMEGTEAVAFLEREMAERKGYYTIAWRPGRIFDFSTDDTPLPSEALGMAPEEIGRIGEEGYSPEGPDGTADVMAEVKGHADPLKNGEEVRPYQTKRTHTMGMAEIEADGSPEYCVYVRPGTNEKFTRMGEADMTGGEAAYVFTQAKETREGPGELWPGLGYQIRHKVKGIVYEWYWARDTGGEETPPKTFGKEIRPGMEKEEVFRRENLYSFVKLDCGRQAASIVKHMKNCGIFGWEDMTKAGLYRLRDEFRQTCAPASARTYMATVKGFLTRYADEREIPQEFREILRNRADRPVKAWLDKDELTRLEKVRTHTDVEKLVKARFLIGAYTGMRVSDALKVTAANERGGMLSYVAQKTGAEATVPCPDKVKKLISYAQENDRELSLVCYNATIRELCKRAKIDRSVKIHHGGETKEGPKWMFVSSHTARISFATNLANLGVPLVKLAGMMGHSSTQMTERYIAGRNVELSSEEMAYFA